MGDKPLVERGLDWLSDFGDFVSDIGAAMPFDVQSPKARFEEQSPGHYNVGNMVADYQHAWLGTAPNHAVPIELIGLLQTLDTMTLELEASIAERSMSTSTRAAKLGLMSTSMPGIGAILWMVLDKSNRDADRALESVVLQLQRWRKRLDAYLDYAESLPIEQEQDRKALLWSVTAPLFLGWFGGPTGSEIALPPDSTAPNFNTKDQHLADIGEPFRIANQLGVWISWEAERRRRLVKDLKDGADDAKDGLGLLIGAGLFAAGAGTAVYVGAKRRKAAAAVKKATNA